MEPFPGIILWVNDRKFGGNRFQILCISGLGLRLLNLSHDFFNVFQIKRKRNELL